MSTPISAVFRAKMIRAGLTPLEISPFRADLAHSRSRANEFRRLLYAPLDSAWDVARFSGTRALWNSGVRAAAGVVAQPVVGAPLDSLLIRTDSRLNAARDWDLCPNGCVREGSSARAESTHLTALCTPKRGYPCEIESAARLAWPPCTRPCRGLCTHLGSGDLALVHRASCSGSSVAVVAGMVEVDVRPRWDDKRADVWDAAVWGLSKRTRRS
ncbi:hypothetical protein C8R43DRAFT_943563 [Mycena crocata]|nr:hypothetical protein C8R43DRAFT_943563 [Mycena crocata]